MNEQHAIFHFKKVQGRRGDVVFAVARPTATFRPQKLIATDNGDGCASLVRQIYVNGEPLFPPPRATWWRRFVSWLRDRPLDRGMPTAVFASDALGNGIDVGDLVCLKNQPIEVEVEFLVDGAVWEGSILGTVPR